LQLQGLQLGLEFVAIVSHVLSTTTLLPWVSTRFDERMLPKGFKCTFPKLAHDRAVRIKQQCRKSESVIRGHLRFKNGLARWLFALPQSNSGMYLLLCRRLVAEDGGTVGAMDAASHGIQRYGYKDMDTKIWIQRFGCKDMDVK
jgi:hypothetical protein